MTPFVSIWKNDDTSESGPSVDEQAAEVTTDFAELMTVLHVASDGPHGLWTVAVTLDAENAVSLIEKVAERYGLTVAPQVLTEPGDVLVTFKWDPRFGRCYDCGNPAAYQALAMYGPDHTPGPEDLFCSVCTAQHAVVDGETFRYLFAEPEEVPS